MRHLILVLIRAVARCFRVCADLLAELGRRAGPEEGEPAAAAVFTGRAAGPPLDWVKRTSPPPPAHWLRLVNERAPGVLGQESGTSDPRGGLVRPLPEPPIFGAPSLRPPNSGRVPV